ncbi:MAG: hypothetical protein ACYDH5_14990 [Acidimicrobiales bacterium]
MELTVERFRALARSSPWRWRTLRFTVNWQGYPSVPETATVRGWLARPDALRVETLDGTLLVASDEPPRPGSYAPFTTGGARVMLPDPPPAVEVAPVYDEDGLVAKRPTEARYDDPMFQNYHWVAMLDPVELADGTDPRLPPRTAVEPPVIFDELVEVDHGGRPAWEARCRPNATYWPRCACCPLLASPQSDALGSPGAPEGFVFAEAHRVRVDLQTGVCVASEELGGTRDGWGHQMQIEAVDEAIPESLFKRPSRFKRGRSAP